ncbi:conserved hypothetical protein [Thiocapsa sp. KS1]|jgi:hypothetical protein|nr:conserved hypothetical protein [Thiocapsa sp. KS1]
MSLVPYHYKPRSDSGADSITRRRIDMSSSYKPYGNPYGYPMAGGMGSPKAQGQHSAVGQGPAMAAYPGYGYAQGYGMTQTGYAAPQAAGQPMSRQSSLLNFGNDRFLKGLLIGAAATYLLTNESVQRTAIKGVVQVWSALQGGIEEAKERFHDAEAELHHAAQSK